MISQFLKRKYNFKTWEKDEVWFNDFLIDYKRKKLMKKVHLNF